MNGANIAKAKYVPSNLPQLTKLPTFLRRQYCGELNLSSTCELFKVYSIRDAHIITFSNVVILLRRFVQMSHLLTCGTLDMRDLGLRTMIFDI